MSDERDETLVYLAGQAAAEERGLLAGVLCSRCTHGTVYRRAGHLQPVAFCGLMRCAVLTDIAECTDYRNPRVMLLHQMQEIALPVDGRIGVSDGAYA